MACSDGRKVLLLLAILLSCWAVPWAVHGHGPKRLQLFAHESRIPPTSTITVSVAPSGSKTGADEFGLIRTVDNVLRATRSNNSTILGSQTGIVVVGKGGKNVYVSFTYYLNENATHQGTIACHGHIDGTSEVDRIFAVVGGTGGFIGVTGDDRSKFDSNRIQSDDIINVHNLTLHYHFRR